jgi:hypothetical protein
MIPQGEQATKGRHEHKDIDVLGVVFVGGIVLLILAVSFFAAQGVLRFTRKGRYAPVFIQHPVGEKSNFPQPRLQVAPTLDLAQNTDASQEQLQSYGWVDRKGGIARIPIERAMQLLVAHGLPNVGVGQTPLQLMQARPVTDTQPANPIGSPTPEESASP